jgi:DNA-binding transcriptional MerR regulator
VAKRTGLTEKAIRVYVDNGLVALSNPYVAGF